MIRMHVFAGTACLVSIFACLPARADDSPTAGHASAAGLLGYGFKDGVGFGLGARVGYTLPMNLYLGGTFVYHLGKSESSALGDVSTNIYYFGVEGGYDIAVSPVVVRPYLGLGDATASATVAGISASASRFAAWPGAAVLYPVGNAFVGGDARFLIVQDFNAFSLFATGGWQF